MAGRGSLRHGLVLAVRMVRGRRVIGLGLAILLVVLAAAVVAPVLAPYDPMDIQPEARLGGPARAHPFGTDDFGRDILSRVLYGARLSLPPSPPLGAERPRTAFLSTTLSQGVGVPTPGSCGPIAHAASPGIRVQTV